MNIVGAHSKTLVIDDTNADQFIGPQTGTGIGYGLIPRDYDKVEYGAVEHAGPVPLPLIPRAEWKDRIREMERTKSRISDIADASEVPCLDQNGYGYCHAFSVCHAAMDLRAIMNQPFKLLSASSNGGPVTGYRNKGAWIMDNLKQAAEVGFAEASLYPMLTTKNEWTPQAEASAAENKVTEWWELQRRNFDEVMTCLLSRVPVVVGLNWWGHAIEYLDPVFDDTGFGVLFQNSWKASWGGMGNGRAILMERGSKSAVPDEAYAPRQLTASQ